MENPDDPVRGAFVKIAGQMHASIFADADDAPFLWLSHRSDSGDDCRCARQPKIDPLRRVRVKIHSAPTRSPLRAANLSLNSMLHERNSTNSGNRGVNARNLSANAAFHRSRCQDFPEVAEAANVNCFQTTFGVTIVQTLLSPQALPSGFSSLWAAFGSRQSQSAIAVGHIAEAEMKNLGLATKRRSSELLQVGRIPVRVIDDGSLNGYQLGAIEVTLLPRTTQTIFHRHRIHTVTFLVTSGTVEFKVANGVFRAGPGDYMAVPIGVPYTFSNPFESSAIFHCAFTPSTLVDYFREMAKITKAAAPPEMNEWIELMARYGIETVDIEAAARNSENVSPSRAGDT